MFLCVKKIENLDKVIHQFCHSEERGITLGIRQRLTILIGGVSG